MTPYHRVHLTTIIGQCHAISTVLCWLLFPIQPMVEQEEKPLILPLILCIFGLPTANTLNPLFSKHHCHQITDTSSSTSRALFWVILLIQPMVGQEGELLILPIFLCIFDCRLTSPQIRCSRPPDHRHILLNNTPL